MISDDLKKILNDDDGLLDSPQKPQIQSGDDRLINSFHEINKFYELNNRIPDSKTSDINERRLYSRLDAIKHDSDKISKLSKYDKYGLLEKIEYPNSVDEIFDDDHLNLLDDDTGILTIKNVPQNIAKPDYIGHQRRCEDFETFEPKFQQVHSDLQDGSRKIVNFTRQKSIVEGNYFVLRGLLVYVDKIGDRFISANGSLDARLRLIFENGTESDILLLSFSKGLASDGRVVTEPNETLLDNMMGIEKDDVPSGYIYVLKSLSDSPSIQEIQNLYKIGFSTRSVEERIRSAENDPTYLMAKVKVVAQYKTYNMNTQKFEHLLHRVFSKVRLNLDLVGLDREKYVPGEWFVIPIDIIDQAVDLIISGNIVDYEYDPLTSKLILKD